MQRTLTPPSSHPLHPATVHFPIAFLTVSYALDVAYGLSTFPQTANYARQVYDLAPHLGDIARFSFGTTTLGFATAIPAVVTGVVELYGMVKRQDVINKLQKSKDIADTSRRLHPKIKIGIAHAWLNYVGLAMAGYNWWTRRSTVMNAPSDTNIIVSGFGLVLLFGAAYLGAQLVFGYGAGVARVSESRNLKEAKAE